MKTDRRTFLKLTANGLASFALATSSRVSTAAQRPNILLVMSDDQSWLHASAYGCKFVQTPEHT